ncbi:zinc finger protein 585A [Solenopsis invicta]|uniref:zinc finger protein 585A n=1 Tax=Solenopsis invicta TaxID=13686 RepID=UPI0001FEA3C9|nr:zinc finger protein 585A [Solenopsis invicta]XP_011159322.1 zinc finger protein 585A [Solenopsis invicta]XP_039304239.1 zinc finger protein 585A [Solenopsis invicta]XP_039304240.1 zinc finger protein 585A [Solenopsis invicta]
MDHEGEQYVTFPLTDVQDAIEESIISHEEICEPVDECVLQEGLTEVTVSNTASTDIVESQGTVEILAEQSEEEDDGQVVYPMYIKQEEQQQYTSGDDESMAVEALRQLGGMYPCFEDKKVSCSVCKNLFTQEEMVEHQSVCQSSPKLSCTTCGERFERKIDLNNHMVCHQVDRPHACRTCGNLFRSKSSLQTHMLQAHMHHVERPHKCNICGSDFQRPSSLSNHMKIHTYVAGRAIMQSQSNNASQSVETFRKWSENASDSPNSSQIPSSSSAQSIQSYDVCQVQWPVSSYNFQNEQSIVTTMANNQDKMDTLQEFTVMPNGEVTQFNEYTEQNNITDSVNNQQYDITINSFNTPDGIVKVETLYRYNNANKREYGEAEVNSSKQYTCKHCGVSFSRATALASHEKIHVSKNWNMPIECEYCDKQFQDGNHLATHQTTCAKKIMQSNIEQGVPNNKWGKHACSECGKKFTTKQKMFRHQWIHRKKTHSCEVCGSQFEKQNELDEHRLSAHPGDSPFTCTECGKSFVSRQGLWEHGRTHAGSPAHFQCDTCSKTFSSRQGYLIHNRTHTGERPYGCKFCWKAFRDGGTLRKHERIHTGERPHVCPLCSRAFNQKVVLREHVRWVHAAGKNETEASSPPYQCPLCGAMNQDRDELCAHIVKHSDQMIAEAKAKTNNDTPVKSKSTKKKSSKSLSSANAQKTEQNEALLSITDTSDKTDDMQIDEKQNNAYVVVTTEKRSDGFIAISELKHSSIRFIVDGKEDENIQVLQVEQDQRDSLNMMNIEKQSDTVSMDVSAESINDTLEETVRQDDMSTIHLIQSPRQDNTLNIISKQNESLPVLAIPNPQGHENYSSQIVQISDANITVDEHNLKEENHIEDEQDSLIPDETSHVIVQYHHDSDDGSCICGICEEKFDGKTTLREHIKIHI